MRPQRISTDGALRSTIKMVYISTGLVVAALGLSLCGLALSSRPAGLQLGDAATELSLAASGFLLGVVGCALLCLCVRRLAAWRTGLAMSDLVARDAERCGWYRRQRHAFGNHMQVVMGLLAFKRLDEAREYIKQVTESLRTDEPLQFETSCPELDGLLRRKIEAAKARGVDVAVLRWDTCHRLLVSMLDACRVIGHALDLAVECAFSCDKPSAVYVRNCTGHTLYTFLIEWGPEDLGSENALPHMGIGEQGASAEEDMRRGLPVSDVASLAEEVRRSGGVFTFGRDSERGFVEFSFPATQAVDQE